MFYRYCALSGERLDAANEMLQRAMRAGDVPPRALLAEGEVAVFAWHRKTIAGVAVYYQPEDHAFLWLDFLFVEAPHRRKGVATELIRRVRGELKEFGLCELQLGTACGNLAMQALAAKCGFAGYSITFTSRAA